MLSALRKKKVAKKILWVVAAMIIPAFVFWGVGNLDKKSIGGKNYVGLVEGKKVGIDDFYSARRAVKIDMLLNYFNQKEMLDKIFENEYLVNRLTWDKILLLDEARKRNIKVSDEEVIGYVTSHPLFINNGQFDQKFYDYMLARNFNMTAREFEEQIRDSLMIIKLRSELIENINLSEDEILEAYKNENQKGKILYLVVESDDFKDEINISDEEVSDYYNENKFDFIIPEQISLEYYKFSYSNPEEKKAIEADIVLLNKKLAKNPEYFHAIPVQYGKDVLKTPLFSRKNIPVDLGWDAQIINELFSRDPGYNVVAASGGEKGAFFVISVKEKIPQRPQSMQEAAESVRIILVQEKSMGRAKAESDNIYSQINEDGISMKNYTDKNRLKLYQSNAISRYDYVENVGEAFDILDKLFNTDNIGNVQPPIKVRKGYLIARLDQLEEIDKNKFEENKDDYRNKVLASKKTKAITSWMTDKNKKCSIEIPLDEL